MKYLRLEGMDFVANINSISDNYCCTLDVNISFTMVHIEVIGWDGVLKT
jgi:hypothetical protein